MVGRREILGPKSMNCREDTRKGGPSTLENLVDNDTVLCFNENIYVDSSFRENELGHMNKFRLKIPLETSNSITKSGKTTPTDDYSTWEKMKKQYGISYADLHGHLSSLTEGNLTTSKVSSSTGKINELNLQSSSPSKGNKSKSSFQIPDPKLVEIAKKLVSSVRDVLPQGSKWDDVTSLELHNADLSTALFLTDILPSLISIDLLGNKLVDFEGFPTQIHCLFLSKNKISTEFTQFDKFNNLKVLDLSHNQITNLECFRTLVNLRVLKLANCDIRKMTSLPVVQRLDLTNNKIRGLVNFECLHFESLTEINLSHNAITRLRLYQSSLKSLRVLNLVGNQITEVQIIDKMPKLKKLTLLGNRNIGQLNVGSKLNRLKSLSVDGRCKLEGKFDELTDINIEHGCRLEAIVQLNDGSGLKINKHLHRLRIVHCGLTFEDLQILYEHYPHISEFDLSHNDIMCSFEGFVEAFTRFKGVKRIDVEHNPMVKRLDNTTLELFRLMVYKMTHK